MYWLKSKIATFGAVLAGLVLAIARHRQVKRQRNAARATRDQLRAHIKESSDIAAGELELDQQYSDLERESERAIENGKMPDSIRNRNRGR